MATITMTAGFAWWYRPMMFSVCFIAALTRMSDDRFNSMITPIIKRAMCLRCLISAFPTH